MIRGKISLRRCDGPLLHRTRGEMFLFPGKSRRCIAAIVKNKPLQKRYHHDYAKVSWFHKIIFTLFHDVSH